LRQVDITELSAAGDLQFIGGTSYRILHGSEMMSVRSSVSNRSPTEESEDEMSLTADE